MLNKIRKNIIGKAEVSKIPNMLLFFPVLLFAIIVVFSCTPKHYNISYLEKMKWMHGKWSSTEEGVTIAEIWNFEQKKSFTVISYIAIGKDTIFKETGQIALGAEKNIMFEASTGHLVTDISEPMKLIKLKGNSFTFQTVSENKTITYKNKKDGLVLIEIIEKTSIPPVKTKYELIKK